MLSESKSPVLEPPRLLAGVTLLYWGAMSGEAFVALIIAVLLEGKNWVKWNWDFDESDYVKAFQTSLGLLGLVLFLVWLDEVNENSLYQVMKWFPLYLLPVELAQRYGKSDRMNLNTFFYFSRQRMKQDFKEGRIVSAKKINTGYPYIFGVLVVASCSSRMDVFVHIAMLALMVAVILAVSVKRGLGWRRLVWALPMMLLVAVWMQSEAIAVYKSYVAHGRAFKDPKRTESSPHGTMLGQLGDIKQSPDIQWRMWGDDVPGYLRLNSYNQHHGVMWSYDYKSAGFKDMGSAFESRAGLEVRDTPGLFVFDGEHEKMLKNLGSASKHVTLRGKGQSDTVESIVPSAEGMLAISDMAGGDITPAVHSLGVLKLVNRKSIIDYKLWTSGENILDIEPDENIDLSIHESCEGAVKELGEEMQLGSIVSPRNKVNAIRSFFMKEFTYSLHFEMPKTSYYKSDIEHFMRKGRKGHCEYFATTAALLLRGQGIPARYCVGYVVREKDGDTWIMRGTHAHAWCSAWIDGKWEIVDLTPPDWLSLEGGQSDAGWKQGLKDWFQNIKQDFAIWRSSEENKSLVSFVMWGLGIGLLLWVSYRLFKVRTRKLENAESLSYASTYSVPKEFESIEAKLSGMIGSRSVAQTYHSWISGSKGKMDENLFTRLIDLVALHEESRFGGVDKSSEMVKSSLDVNTLLNE